MDSDWHWFAPRSALKAARPPPAMKALSQAGGPAPLSYTNVRQLHTNTQHNRIQYPIRLYAERKAKVKKQAKSFRLSEMTVKELEAMSKRWQLGQAEVISLLVHAAEAVGWEDEDKFHDMIQLARRI